MFDAPDDEMSFCIFKKINVKEEIDRKTKVQTTKIMKFSSRSIGLVSA